MSVDILDETYQEYKDRLRKMSDEELQDMIGFYSHPGYNCEGLALNDEFITPRWKIETDILRERNRKCEMEGTYNESRTKIQFKIKSQTDLIMFKYQIEKRGIPFTQKDVERLGYDPYTLISIPVKYSVEGNLVYNMIFNPI